MGVFLTLHDPATAGQYYDTGVWTDDTFYSLAKAHASQAPERVALIDGANAWTWSDVVARADALAADLSGAGLVRGDRVCLWLSNRAHAVVAFIACSRQGFACNPSLHRTYTCAEIRTLAARLDAAAFITEANWGADRDRVELASLLEDLPTLKKFYDFADLPEPGLVPSTPPVHAPDAVAYMAFTSGTTGPPKCVMHSSNTLMSNARDMVRDWRRDTSTRLLSLSPLSHHIAWVGVSQWLICGGTFITHDPPAGLSTLDWTVQSQADYVMGVPTHAMDLLDEQRRAGESRLGSVRSFYMAGSPIPPSVAEAFVAQGISPQNVYGMTENSSHQYPMPDDPSPVMVTTCGRGGPAYSIRIFDSDATNREVSPGEVGEIAGKGGALMLGYFANQAETARSFNADGWFLSGDLGWLDTHGNLHVAGRSKDLIIRGGHNIHPTHIEALALRHPAVQKCAVVPVADQRLGEKVCMTLIGSVEPDELFAHLDAEGLSIYDMPEYFLEVVEYPLTASGKILKRELIEMLDRGELVPTPIRFPRSTP
ncbi:MAG: acyl--CoA ligase [Chromatiales bacterium]|jgi:acyl-CoA synthetase|nr:acyl--CoA ligase [Chromatiales bacterium]